MQWKWKEQMSRIVHNLNRREINEFKRAPDSIKKREVNSFLRQSGINMQVLNEIVLDSYKKSIIKHFGMTTYDPSNLVIAIRNTLYNMMAEKHDIDCQVLLWEAQNSDGEIYLFEEEDPLADDENTQHS